MFFYDFGSLIKSESASLKPDSLFYNVTGRLEMTHLVLWVYREKYNTQWNVQYQCQNVVFSSMKHWKKSVLTFNPMFLFL